MRTGDEAGQHPPPPKASPTGAPGRERRWYRGDCHVHSVFSNGAELTPHQLQAEARTAGLDFLAVTEHNTADSHDAWSTNDDDLLVILGQEVTTRTGHWLALGIAPGQVVDWRYGVRQHVIDRHLDEVHQAGGLCVAAHPHASFPAGAFMYPYQGFDAVEVWSGPWTSDGPWQADNEAALAEWGRSLAADIYQGRWRPAMGNSDTHLRHQIGTTHTVVLADELSTEAILAGIHAGRSWIAASPTIDVSFTAHTGHHTVGIGEQLTTHNEPAAVRVDVNGVPGGTVSFHTERGKAHHASLPDTGPGTIEWHAHAKESAFVRIEVRGPEGHMAALSNPILLI